MSDQSANARLIRAARDVVRLMDKPIIGTSKEAAKAWRAATRLARVLRELEDTLPEETR